jgi:hypothetical protein
MDIRAGSALALMLLALAGCGGNPMPFPVPESEMAPAPGLFSGPTGSFAISLVKDEPPDPASGPASGGAPK